MKYIVYFWCMAIILILTSQQTQAPQPPNLTVTMPLDKWNSLIFAVSNKDVKGVTITLDQSIMNELIAQLNRQLADTTTIAKPIPRSKTDSTKKK